MAKDLYIQDTAKVFFTSLKSGNVVGVGYAQMAGLEGTEEESDMRGGVGNKLAYTIRSSKDLALSVTSATFKPEFLEMTQGSEYVTDTMDVTDSFFITIETAGEFDIPTELTDLNLATVRVEGTDGVQKDQEVTGGKVTLDPEIVAEKGDEIEVFYLKSVTGRSIEFNAAKHGAKVKVEYETICYDRETADVYSDIYFVFPECIPSGNFSMNLQNGEAYIPEMNFKVTAPKNSDVLGKKMEVLRKP